MPSTSTEDDSGRVSLRSAGAVLGAVAFLGALSTLAVGAFGISAVLPAKKFFGETGIPLPALAELGIQVVTFLQDYGYVVWLAGLALAIAAPIVARRTDRAGPVFAVGLAGIALFALMDLALVLGPTGAWSALSELERRVDPDERAMVPGETSGLARHAIDAFRDAVAKRKGTFKLASGEEHAFVLYDGPGVTDLPVGPVPDYASCWKKDSCLLLPWAPAGSDRLEPLLLFPRPETSDRGPAALEPAGLRDEGDMVPGQGGSMGFRWRRVFDAPTSEGAKLASAFSIVRAPLPSRGAGNPEMWSLAGKAGSPLLARVTLHVFRGFDRGAVEASPQVEKNFPVESFSFWVSP